MTNNNQTPSLLSRTWLTISNHTWLPLRNLVYNHVYLHIRWRRLRSKAIRHEEALKRLVRISLNFNEQTGRTSFTLKVHNIIIDSLPDGTDENAVKNLISHCNYLRTLNRHNINYAKL